MSSGKANIDFETQRRARSNELTLLTFMATVVMLFAAFTSSYLIRKTGPDWKTLSLPAIVWFNTVLLIPSSVTMELSRWKQSRMWLKVTTGLGIAFLIGQVLLWKELVDSGVYVRTYAYGSFLYMLTGIHGLHLLGGVAALLVVNFRRGAFGLCAVYWHFVDAVWLYVLLMLSVL